jgi:periplasmic protein TonB
MATPWAHTEMLPEPQDGFRSTLAQHPVARPPAAPVPRAPRTPIQIAIAVSLALHLLLLFVQLATPGSAPRQWLEDRLDVILVNAQGPRAADKPKALAQANLAGGGDGAPDERALSPLPPTPGLELGESPDLQQRAVQALVQESQALLTQVRRELARLPEPNPQREAATAEGREQAERRRLLLEQLAQIERRVNENSAGPRQRFVSPATQEVVYALYYDQVRRRIEQRGTRDFPSQGGRKLYGALTMTITLDASGRVMGTEVVAPSGNALLDKRAAAIVQAASPFGRFSAAMLKEAEVLTLSARFTFDRDHGVQAQLQEPVP